MEKRVLLIDQDTGWQSLLKRVLEQEGFSVITAVDGQEGIRKVYQCHPQAIILDVMADEMDGWATCQRLRQVCDTPILIHTAMARTEDVVRGLSLGADAYLPKTTRFGELSARIRALLRRGPQDRSNRDNVYEDGTLYVDLEKEIVALRGETVDLTPTESRLLMYLVSQRGRIVPYRELLVRVWGPECAEEKGYLTVYIRYLRQKLQENPARPRYICTRSHVGYYFAGKSLIQSRRLQQAVPVVV
jgi:two-component system KDP operon response regulator KdpE